MKRTGKRLWVLMTAPESYTKLDEVGIMLVRCTKRQADALADKIGGYFDEAVEVSEVSRAFTITQARRVVDRDYAESLAAMGETPEQDA